MDKISLQGMVFYAYHGVTDAEKELGQSFIVDLVIEKNLRFAGVSDDIKDTVDYAEAYKVVKDLVKGSTLNLLESVAESIASTILNDFDVESVLVTVKKTQPFIQDAVLSQVSVEVWRKKTTEQI